MNAPSQVSWEDLAAVPLRELICYADSILPGSPAPRATDFDPRWQAIIAIGQHLRAEPEPIWEFIVRWGGHSQEDLRDSFATCLVEHLLAAR